MENIATRIEEDQTCWTKKTKYRSLKNHGYAIPTRQVRTGLLYPATDKVEEVLNSRPTSIDGPYSQGLTPERVIAPNCAHLTYEKKKGGGESCRKPLN